MVRAIMHGCNGKMGRAITTLAKEDAEVEIVAGVDAYTEVANEYPVFDSIEKCDVEADVVIDFSPAKAVDGLLDYCVEKQIPVVLCTTGLSEEQLQEVEEASKKVAVLRSANMSLGVNTVFKLAAAAAKILGEVGYDIEIVEKHQLSLPDTVTNIIKCKNPRCITSIEQELPHTFKLTDRKNRIYRCIYCESKFKGN